jgi:uncharacterized membrane protein YgcG
MTYRVLFFNILVSIFFCIGSPLLNAGQMMPNMEDFEKELAEANRAIEEYVSSLSPEEQAAFNQSVADMTQMFENMSDQEFEQFLGEMFADDPSMMMEPNPFDVIEPAVQEPIVEVVLSTQDKQKAETALAIIDDIIAQSNLFMVLVNSSSELPARINQWAKKGAIANWQSEKQWDAFKKEIELFVQKLYRAEDQDLTTKKYKFLLELIADEALYNNLIQLQTELKTLVSLINIPEFGIQKLSAASKETIKSILSKYAESFYLLNIPQSLDALFLKYAPEEEKIRLAEEAANKRSVDAARTPRTPVGPTSAGSEGDMGYGGYDDYYGSYDPYGGYGGYDPYGGYGGYDNYGGYGDYDNSYGGSSEGGGGKSSGGGGSSGGSGRGGDELADTEDDKEKSKDEKDKKGKRSKDDKFIPNYKLELAIAELKNNFKDINDVLKEDEEGNPSKLADLGKLFKEENVDIILAGSILPNIVDKKISAMNEAMETINKESVKLNAQDLAHYQREISKFFETNKKTLETLRKSIDAFEQVTDEQKKNIALAGGTAEPSQRIDIKTLPKAVQWAYFGAEELEEGDAELTEKIASRVSLFDIKENIDELFDNAKKFAAVQAKVQVPRKEREPVLPVEELELE